MSELPESFINNLLNQSGVTFSFASANYSADEKGRLNDYMGLEQWQQNSIASEIINIYANSIAIDSLIIYNHTIGGVSVALVGADDAAGSNPVTLDKWSQADNENILRKIDQAAHSYLRISIPAGAQAHAIGEIYAGIALQWPRNPSAPLDTEGTTSRDEVKRSDRGVKNSRGRFDLVEIDNRFSPMTQAHYETFKTLWKATRAHIAFFYAFNPDTEPESVLLVRANMKKFTAKLNANLREGLQYPLIEVK